MNMNNKTPVSAVTGTFFGRQPSLKILQDRIRKARIKKERKVVAHEFWIGPVLGKGTYGVVVEAKDTHGNVYAMKIDRQPEPDHSSREVRMLKILKKLNCGQYNCIELINSYHLGKQSHIQFPMYGPTIWERIRPGNGFMLGQIKEILGQLFSAVDFLHRHHIAHLDIKTNNVIFLDGQFSSTFEKDSNTFRIKMNNTRVLLIDFGFATMRPDTKKFRHSVCAQVYKPPEVIFNTGISYPVDIWCLGLVGAAMYLGRELFRTGCVKSSLLILVQMEIVLGNFPPEIIKSFRAQQYFCHGKTKTYSGIAHFLVKKSVPLNQLKKSASSETSKLFALLEKMLSLDSRKRPTSGELLPSSEGSAIF